MASSTRPGACTTTVISRCAHLHLTPGAARRGSALSRLPGPGQLCHWPEASNMLCTARLAASCMCCRDRGAKETHFFSCRAHASQTLCMSLQHQQELSTSLALKLQAFGPGWRAAVISGRQTGRAPPAWLYAFWKDWLHTAAPGMQWQQASLLRNACSRGPPHQHHCQSAWVIDAAGSHLWQLDLQLAFQDFQGSEELCN